MDHLLAIIVGFSSGIVWEYLGLKPYGKFETFFRSRYVEVTGKQIHLHHWLLYLLVLIILGLWGYKTDRLSHPFLIYAFALLFGAFTYGLVKYPDWLRFVK